MSEKYRNDGKKIYTFLEKIEKYHPEIRVKFADFDLCRTLQLLSPNNNHYCSNQIEIKEVNLISKDENKISEEISTQKASRDQGITTQDYNKTIPLESFTNITISYCENGSNKEINGSFLKNTRDMGGIKDHFEANENLSMIESDDKNAVFGITLNGSLPYLDKTDDGFAITSENFKTLLAYRYYDATTFLEGIL